MNIFILLFRLTMAAIAVVMSVGFIGLVFFCSINSNGELSKKWKTRS